MSELDIIIALCESLENIRKLATSLATYQYGGLTKDVVVMRLTRSWIAFMTLAGASPTEWDKFEQLMTLGRYDILAGFPSSILPEIAARLPPDCLAALHAYVNKSNL